MDTEATVDAMNILQSGLERKHFDVLTPLGRAIVESALYHLRTGLRDYLTKGK